MSDHFADRLLQWYDRHGRHNLPWHQNRNAYRVWVSEIMLQQTQVTTVIPYFRAFMERFPTVRDLAEAPVDDVLGHWSGLGYYARARNLQKAAIRVMEDHGGEFPGELEALEALPGIGRSTAAAIIAQAWDRRAAILDGNVKRVLARYHSIPGWPGQTATLNALWQRAEEHTPDSRARDYTQAIMDLGALVCTRSRPDCVHCPVSAGCTAYANDETHLYPGRKPKRRNRRRPPGWSSWKTMTAASCLSAAPSGIWGGLWSLPELDPAFGPEELQDACERQFGLSCSEPDLISGFRHTFSHYHLHIQPARLQVASNSNIRDDADQRWLHRESALDLACRRPSAPFLAIRDRLPCSDLLSSLAVQTIRHPYSTGAPMSRTVFCRKYQKDMEGLQFLPMPGAKGQDIYENISKQAWEEWQAQQTMLINEKHLSLMDPNTRKYLQAQMERFFNNEPFDKAEGYVPPEK